jgi:hypothetical protein
LLQRCTFIDTKLPNGETLGLGERFNDAKDRIF